MYCWITNHQKLRAENNKRCKHSSYGLTQLLRIRVWEQLSWVVLAQGFVRGCVFPVWGHLFASSLTWCWQASVACWPWPEASVLTTWLLHRPPGCLHAMAAGCSRSEPRGSESPQLKLLSFIRTSQSQPHRAIHHVTAHACCLLLARHTTPGDRTGCDARRWGVLGGVLEGGCHLEAEMLSEFHG